eukprot:gb/GECH01010157.1/.p1 GENE.gb/GECH01010157.1/~~gb/GECH01010157.1/.p1  ORF type:complete len:373 (+),score=51.30 gb/GECH01010157.1/:1-1119(+)
MKWHSCPHEAPEPICCHSLSCLDLNQILLYGGESSLHSHRYRISKAYIKKNIVHNDSSMTKHDGSSGWQLLEGSLSLSPRCGHTATVLDHRRRVYVLGGWDWVPKHRPAVLYTPTLQWSSLHPAPSRPAPRFFHSAVAHNGAVYIFGGMLHSGSRTAALYRFRPFPSQREGPAPTAGEWEPIEGSGDVPMPRNSHTAHMVTEEEMWIFGGRNEYRRMNDVYCFHLASHRWRYVPMHGDVPSSRSGHSGVVLPHAAYRNSSPSSSATVTGRRHSILIYGGWDGEHALADDLYLLHAAMNTWQRVQVRTGLNGGPIPTPAPRHAHATVMADHRWMVMCGGEGNDGEPRKDMWLLDTCMLNILKCILLLLLFNRF